MARVACAAAEALGATVSAAVVGGRAPRAPTGMAAAEAALPEGASDWASPLPFSTAVDDTTVGGYATYAPAAADDATAAPRPSAAARGPAAGITAAGSSAPAVVAVAAPGGESVALVTAVLPTGTTTPAAVAAAMAAAAPFLASVADGVAPTTFTAVWRGKRSRGERAA